MSKEYKITQLKSVIGEELYRILKSYDCFIAGGAITSLYSNQDINDIDVYFRDKKDIIKIMSSVLTDSPVAGDGDLSHFSLHIKFYTNRSILCGMNGVDHDIQFITFKEFSSADEIFDTFDFTVCMGAFDFKTEEIVLHKDFLEHVSGRYLKFNSNTAFPLISDQRVAKYVGKGYSISKAEKMRVVLACMELKLESWEDAANHVGGMYGMVIEEMFDRDKEFSVVELMSQLDNINDNEIPKHVKDQQDTINFKDIVESIFPGIHEIVDSEIERLDTEVGTYFNTDKYHYRCCSAGYKSYYNHYSIIKYEEGSVVNGGTMGIYVHSDPCHPYINTQWWVELEPTSNCTVHEGRGGEARIAGDVKVVRQFEYKPGYSDTEEIAWCNVLGLGDNNE